MCRLNHLFDARQMVWQVTKITLGRWSLGNDIGIMRGVPDGLSFGNSSLKVFECQLAIVGVQLL